MRWCPGILFFTTGKEELSERDEVAAQYRVLHAGGFEESGEGGSNSCEQSGTSSCCQWGPGGAIVGVDPHPRFCICNLQAVGFFLFLFGFLLFLLNQSMDYQLSGESTAIFLLCMKVCVD